ncbi:MAG: OmpA family protein [Cyanobacteria bacterium P01_A01_bin.17]
MHDLSSENNLSSQHDQDEPDKHLDESGASLDELRSLLLGPELQARIMDLKLRPEDISRALPEAIILSAEEQGKLTTAAVPTVEDAIRNSVNQDHNILSEALFPVIGPATRKAVSAALQNLTQSLNEGLEHSLSLQSFQWRIEAARTGKSFAEIVLLRTLLYQVEQVLLIHKDTGLLLQQLVADTVIAQDADLVSAMLTAIQDFIKDSFRVERGDSLDTLQFGELTVWIEEGPQALMACVIRGTAPQDIRGLFQDVLEKIHLVCSQDLKQFQGDNAAFAQSQPYLQECLQAQFKPKRRSLSPLAWLFLGLILLGIGWQIFGVYQRRKVTGRYVATLQQQPGLVVVDSKLKNRKILISGMRDPLAVDPLSLAEPNKINPQKVKTTWEPYLSFHPELVKARAEQRLQPPATVSLSVDGQNTLVATGTAKQNWIAQLQKQALQIPGVMQVSTDQLKPAERQTLNRLQKQIEGHNILFDEGQSQPLPTSESIFQQLAQDVEAAVKLATALNLKLALSIEGRADRVGTERENFLISQARANAIRERLIRRQISPSILTIKPLGAAQGSQTQEQSLSERRVSFKVTLEEL